MKVLFATSEAVPFIASGGLADVSGALPRALKHNKVICDVIMPLYADIKPKLRKNLKYITDFTVELAWRKQYCGLFEGTANGVKYYFIDNEYYFGRKNIYGFYDDAERFAFFSKAVLDAIKYMDFVPDIIHANDWQTAMVSVYLNTQYKNIELYKNIKTVFTIHNIQYQGKYGQEILEYVLGLDPSQAGIVHYDDCLNLLKGAIECSDRVTTVSPSYSKEILDPWFAHGLDRYLVTKQDKIFGILNGIDMIDYNPETDKALFKNYSSRKLADKRENRRKLLEQLNLPDEKNSMLVSMVTRLVSHKGLDLVKYIFEEMLSLNIKVVILGTGDYEYEEFFSYMQEKYPNKVRMIKGFIPELARQIYASSDVFLMPSKIEPCGLAQMIAARYGAVPIVRQTGGLNDTIRDYSNKNANGFTFYAYNAHDMLNAVRRAENAFKNKKKWKQLQINGMNTDFSWSKSSKEYINLYNQLTN